MSVNLEDLPVHQLQTVRHQLDEEIQVLTRSFASLKQAQHKFNESLQCLKGPLDQQVLVPLTNSLYVPGTLNNKIMVDVGTGYYCEMDQVKAQDFYSRKVEYVQTNLNTLETTVNQRHGQKQALIQVLEAKLKSLAGKGKGKNE